MLIDAHFHLDYWKEEEARNQVIKQALSGSVLLMHTVGTSVDTSRQAVGFAAQHDPVYAGIGIHSWNACPIDKTIFATLKGLASQKKVISICEIGLDYTRNPETKELQQEAFRQQIRLAREVRLPIMVHNDVQSQPDVLKILVEERAREVGGAIHGFRGDTAYARECLAMGLYISFGKALAREGAGPLLEVAKHTPNDRLLIETDAAGEDGNGPHTVTSVAQTIAEEKGLPLEKLGNMVTANFKRLFRP